MANFTLYIDTYQQRLIGGLNDSTFVDPSSLPLFFGDTITLNVYLLAPLQVTDPSQWNYQIIPTTGLQLFVYLDDGTIDPVAGNIYAQQITWTTDPDQEYFAAEFALNTVNLAALMNAGNSKSASCWIKIGYVQNGYQTTVFSIPVTVNAGLPETNLIVPAGQTPLSAEVARATFFPQQPVAGMPLQLMSPLGKIIELRCVDLPDGTADIQKIELN